MYGIAEDEASGLKLYDVERYLEKWNSELGNPADPELAAFKSGSKMVCNKIKAEISGISGEEKAFRSLERLHSKCRILKNIELQSENEKSEIDAIVFTSKAIFIIEVKNTRKDIFIDEDGNYYKTGEYTVLHSNITSRLEVKESLLRTVVSEDTAALNIEKIVVFTNNRVQIHNRNNSLKTCFLGQLPYIIDEYPGEDRYSDEQMDYFWIKLKEADHTEAYPMTEMNIDQFKTDFAKLLSKLESPKENEKEEVDDVRKNGKNKTGFIEKIIFPKVTPKFGTALATIIMTIIAYRK